MGEFYRVFSKVPLHIPQDTSISDSAKGDYSYFDFNSPLILILTLTHTDSHILRSVLSP